MNNIKGIFPSHFSYWVNTILFPLKMLIPQPVIRWLPILMDNEEIRINAVLHQVNGMLLDIGCGINSLVKSYEQTGKRGKGVDVFQWNNSVLKIDDSSNLPFSSCKFDTITLVACFNHITNRLGVLKEIHRLLKEDGRVVLTNLSPFIGLIWHKWAFWDRDQNVRGLKSGELYGLKFDYIDQIFSQSGFQLAKTIKFSWNLNALYIYKKVRK